MCHANGSSSYLIFWAAISLVSPPVLRPTGLLATLNSPRSAGICWCQTRPRDSEWYGESQAVLLLCHENVGYRRAHSRTSSTSCADSRPYRPGKYHLSCSDGAQCADSCFGTRDSGSCGPRRLINLSLGYPTTLGRHFIFDILRADR